ncbi:MAG: hypothetical protein ACI88L_000133 [Candidatus Paceibacteria bacterium]|jgi:hypothetical protein
MSFEQPSFRKCSRESDHGHFFLEGGVCTTAIFCKEHALEAVDEIIKIGELDEKWRAKVTYEISDCDLPEKTSSAIENKIKTSVFNWKQINNAAVVEKEINKTGFSPN